MFTDDEWIKTNVVYAYNRILFSLKKKKGNSAICDDAMNLKISCYLKRASHRKTNTE